MKTKLTKLEQKARAEGKHAVAATAADLLTRLDSMDAQINLIGALHEVGYLQNSLAPYWKAFRTDETAWIDRCLARLLGADHDYWAVAALLGCTGATVTAQAKALGFAALETRRCSRFGQPDVLVDTWFKDADGNVLHPFIEIGCDAQSGVVVDFARARALLLGDEQWQIGKPVGSGSLAYFVRAALPHGAWRMVSAEFQPG